jgi:hypothetical protein
MGWLPGSLDPAERDELQIGVALVLVIASKAKTMPIFGRKEYWSGIDNVEILPCAT